MKRIFIMALLVGFTGLIAEEAQNSTPSTKIQVNGLMDVRSVDCNESALIELYRNATDKKKAGDIILAEIERCEAACPVDKLNAYRSTEPYIEYYSKLRFLIRMGDVRKARESFIRADR